MCFAMIMVLNCSNPPRLFHRFYFSSKWRKMRSNLVAINIKNSFKWPEIHSDAPPSLWEGAVQCVVIWLYSLSHTWFFHVISLSKTGHIWYIFPRFILRNHRDLPAAVTAVIQYIGIGFGSLPACSVSQWGSVAYVLWRFNAGYLNKDNSILKWNFWTDEWYVWDLFWHWWSMTLLSRLIPC